MRAGGALIVCHSRGFVFVHLHKTAGESITATLAPVLVAGDEVVKGSPPAAPAGVALGKHSTAGEARDVLGVDRWERYFTFSFVRHPIDRTLSLYRYIARLAEPPKPTLRQRLGRHEIRSDAGRERWPEMRAYRETASLSEFIRHPLVDHAVALRPQATSLCDDAGDLLVDYVGRFERLAPDVAHVQRTLGLPETPLRSLNTSPRGELPDDLTREDREYLASRFEEDFVRFGYAP